MTRPRRAGQRRRRRKKGGYKAGSAVVTVNAWLEAWRRRDWSAMTMQCQTTWVKMNREFVRSPSGWLEDAFGPKLLVASQIVDVAVNGAVADCTVRVAYRVAGKVQHRRLKLRVIAEEAPFRLSAAGGWGVNPVSALNDRPI